LVRTYSLNLHHDPWRELAHARYAGGKMRQTLAELTSRLWLATSSVFDLVRCMNNDS